MSELSLRERIAARKAQAPDNAGDPEAVDAAEGGEPAEPGAHLELPGIAHKFDISDKRFKTGFRYALEAAGIPLPTYALRKPSGRAASALREIAAVTGQHIEQAKRDFKV